MKDLLCLPRPHSPPLQRITMSGSAALEYGFPSTHSTNAVSVAVWAIHMLKNGADTQNPTVHIAFQVLFYFYAVSIVFGRLYCGMHGFFDVAVGSALGALLAAAQIFYGDWFDVWICQDSINPVIFLLLVLFLIRIHPEPADDCPCFDDSVCFAAVLIGCQIGAWHYSQTGFAIDYPIPSTVPFEFREVGLLKSSIRIVLGVLIVFAWRGLIKPALFKILPPIFRGLERVQMNLPRAFFLDASKYSSIPHLRGDDNVIPSASDIPRMIGNLSHPRKRSVSVGPQSVADAYETIAYRNKKRRESLVLLEGESLGSVKPTSKDLRSDQATNQSRFLSPKNKNSPPGVNLLPTPMQSRVQSYEHMMGTAPPNISLTPPETEDDFAGEDDGLGDLPGDEEKEDREIFMKIERPRVRYDVEVVTKLIVYSGIAWLAVEGNPILFEFCGLGMGVYA